MNTQIRIAHSSRVPAVQGNVVRYIEERSSEAGHRGFLLRCESADRIRPLTYAPMVRGSERPIPMDPGGKKLGLPKPGTAASLDMCSLLQGRLWDLYCRSACLQKLDYEAPKKTEKCPLVWESQCAQFITKLYETGIVESVCERPKTINVLFGVPEDDGRNQDLILDARRANCHFIEMEYSEHSHSMLSIQIENYEEEEVHMGKLNIDNVYH